MSTAAARGLLAPWAAAFAWVTPGPLGDKAPPVCAGGPDGSRCHSRVTEGLGSRRAKRFFSTVFDSIPPYNELKKEG